MKLIRFFLGLFFVSNTLLAQYTSQNISLYAQWDDTSVVAEPIYNIRYNSVWGWKNQVQNKEYAILGASSGTYFIDITNPYNPIQCDFVPGRRGNCIWREYKTYSHYAYLVSDDSPPNSFQIVDLNYLPDSVHVVYDSDQLFRNAHTVFIDGSKLYCGYNRTLTSTYSMAVYDLAANPELPVFLRALNQDDPSISLVHDMFVRNDTVYASCGFDGFNVYKFTGSTFVKLGSMTNYPFSGYNHSSAMANGSTTMVFCDEVPTGLPAKVMDVSNPSNLSVISTFSTGTLATPHNPFMLGNHVVIAYYQDGLQIFDVSNPANVVLSGFFDTNPSNCLSFPNPNYTGCWGAYVDLPSGTILASDMQNGLFILNADSALGISKNSDNIFQFNIAPNPTESVLYFQSRSNVSRKVSIEIYDALSQKVFGIESAFMSNLKPFSIDVSNLSKGIYFVKVSNSNTSSINRFIKN